MSEEQVIQNTEVSQDNASDLAPPAESQHLADKMIKEALDEVRSQPTPEKEETELEKPKGYNRVDVDNPEVQDRINYLYKQVKSSDETNKVIRTEYGKIADALAIANQQIESLTSRQVKQDDSDALQHIRNEMKRFRELGDDEQADKYNEMLIDLKATQKLKEHEALQRKSYLEAQQQYLQQQQQQAPKFSKEEVDYATSLRDEKDETGTPLRPWMQADNKDLRLAQTLAADLVADREKKGEPVVLKDVFAELDRIMFEKHGIKSKKPTPKQPEVLSGLNLTAPTKNVPIKLSDAEKFAARKLNVSTEQYAKSKMMAEKYSRVSIDDL